MSTLLSKLQYKKSEKGEFHNIQPRSLEETIELVFNYPWDIERSLASIELTCPSITVEHPVGTYLKIGPYFSGKFSVYYLNTNGKVYLKTVTTLDDACTWVITYFEHKGTLDNFEKYGFVLNPLNHFKTNPFEYMINRKAIIHFFRFPLYMMPVFWAIALLNFLDKPDNFTLFAPLGLTLLFQILFIPLIYLFFNYYSADKNKYLQLSKGHNEFIYGTANNPRRYHKEDIEEINTYGVYNSRSLWRECEIYHIAFKDGEQIQFTSLLISGNTLRMKFPDHQIKDNRTFFPRI